VLSRICQSIVVGEDFFWVRGVKNDDIATISMDDWGVLADFGTVVFRFALGGGEISRDTEARFLFILYPITLLRSFCSYTLLNPTLLMMMTKPRVRRAQNVTALI
jgi:hypothetical protein